MKLRTAHLKCDSIRTKRRPDNSIRIITYRVRVGETISGQPKWVHYSYYLPITRKVVNALEVVDKFGDFELKGGNK